MKLHNKFEIIKNGKRLALGYNKMFPRVLEAIEDYIGFARYVAVAGTMGQTTSELSGDELNSCLGVFRATDIEFQLNPLVSTMYARRKITIPQNALSGALVTAVGFCALPDGVVDDGQSPQICQSCNVELYNYAEIKNSQGNAYAISIGSDEIEIISTVYLDWETNQGVLPLGGNNEFIKFLLGSNVYGGSAPTFDFGVGCDHRSNDRQVEQDYIYTKKYMTAGVVPTVTRTNSAIEFLFATSRLTSCLTCELALAANDKVVIRQNRDRFMTDETYEESVVTSEYGVTTLLQYNTGDIVKVENRLTSEVIYDMPEEIAQLQRFQYPSVVSEPRAYMFGEDKDYYTGWTVFESKCGNMLAFLKSDTLDIYENKSGNIVKKDTSAVVNPQTITDIQFFDDYVFLIRNTSEYVEMYEIHDGKLVKMNFRLSEAIAANMSTYSFTNSASQKISIGKDGNGKITVAIKFDADTLGIFVFTKNGRIYECTTFYKPALTAIGVFGALVARGTEKGYVVVCGVDSTTYPNVYTYCISEGLVIVDSLLVANDFSTDVEEYRIGANFIHLRRSSSAYNVIWFFDNYLRRIKPADDSTHRFHINKKGTLAFRTSTANTDIIGIFVRENSTPLSFMSSVNQTVFANWKAVYIFGNAGVVIRDDSPHCLFIDFGERGYTTIKGLPPSLNLTITAKLSLPQYERNNCRNFLMSLVVEIGEDQ